MDTDLEFSIPDGLPDEENLCTVLAATRSNDHEVKPSFLEPPPDLSSNTESGWAAIAKCIREVDEEKIKDYKEDIDTILVFVSTDFFP